MAYKVKRYFYNSFKKKYVWHIRISLLVLKLRPRFSGDCGDLKEVSTFCIPGRNKEQYI